MKPARFLAVALTPVLFAGCGTLGIGGRSPQSAASVTYEAKYAQASLTGEADVTYTAADGSTVTKKVAMPWQSEPIAVQSGRSYRLVATAPKVVGSSFYCGVHTDTRWNAGNSEPDGKCSYTFPDDVGH